MKKILFALFIALSPTLLSASMFPSDTISKHFEYTGNVTAVLVLATSTRTILSIDYQSADNSARTFLYCGGISEENEIYETHNTIQQMVSFIQYVCDSAIYVSSSGVGSVDWHYILTYTDRNITTTQDPMPIAVSGATSTISVGDIIATYDGANFQETLFIACVIIFFLTFMAWGRFFRMFRKHDEI